MKRWISGADLGQMQEHRARILTCREMAEADAASIWRFYGVENVKVDK